MPAANEQTQMYPKLAGSIERRSCLGGRLMLYVGGEWSIAAQWTKKKRRYWF